MKTRLARKTSRSSDEAAAPVLVSQLRSRNFTPLEATDATTEHSQSGFDAANVPVLAPSAPVQAKLTVGQPGDKYEQEADAVAAKVVNQIHAPQSSGPAGAVQREAAAPEEEEEMLQQKPLAASIQRADMPEEEELQAKPLVADGIQRTEAPEENEEELAQMNPVLQREAMPEEEEEAVQAKPEIQREALPKEEESLQQKPLIQAKATGEMAAPQSVESKIAGARGGGQAMSEETRAQMEGAFGADFSGVRVHTGARSDQLNRSLQSRAFATGQDIFFRRGEFNPGSRGGQELLAHELTHTLQQSPQKAGTALPEPKYAAQRQPVSAGVSRLQRDAMVQRNPAGVAAFAGLSAEAWSMAANVAGTLATVGGAAAGTYTAVKRGENGFSSLVLPQNLVSNSDKAKLQQIAQFRIINKYIERYLGKGSVEAETSPDNSRELSGKNPAVEQQNPSPAAEVPDGSPTVSAINQAVLNSVKQDVQISLQTALEKVTNSSEQTFAWGEDNTTDGKEESVGVTGFLKIRNVEVSVLKETLSLSEKAKEMVGEISGHGTELVVHKFIGGSVGGHATWSAWDNLTVNVEGGAAQTGVSENGAVKLIIRTHWYWDRWGPNSETWMQNEIRIQDDSSISFTAKYEGEP